jgi:uncharacterized membrane protein
MFSLPMNIKLWTLILLTFCLVVIWLYLTPPTLMGKADAIGYAVCHRIPVRSYSLGDRQYPFCIRCSGMYLSALVGFLYQVISGGLKKSRIPEKRILFVLLFFIIVFVIDGLNSYFTLFSTASLLYEPQHWLRLFSGSGMGLALSIILLPTFNRTVWKDYVSESYFPRFWIFLFLLLIVLILNLILHMEVPAVLQTGAILSAVSVILILTMVYTMLLLIITHEENKSVSISSLLKPGFIGLCVAFFQIVFLDLLRYLATGTWDGFPLGG